MSRSGQSQPESAKWAVPVATTANDSMPSHETWMAELRAIHTKTLEQHMHATAHSRPRTSSGAVAGSATPHAPSRQPSRPSRGVASAKARPRATHRKLAPRSNGNSRMGRAQSAQGGRRPVKGQLVAVSPSHPSRSAQASPLGTSPQRSAAGAEAVYSVDVLAVAEASEANAARKLKYWQDCDVEDLRQELMQVKDLAHQSTDEAKVLRTKLQRQDVELRATKQALATLQAVAEGGSPAGAHSAPHSPHAHGDGQGFSYRQPAAPLSERLKQQVVDLRKQIILQQKQIRALTPSSGHQQQTAGAAEGSEQQSQGVGMQRVDLAHLNDLLAKATRALAKETMRRTDMEIEVRQLQGALQATRNEAEALQQSNRVHTAELAKHTALLAKLTHAAPMKGTAVMVSPRGEEQRGTGSAVARTRAASEDGDGYSSDEFEADAPQPRRAVVMARSDSGTHFHVTYSDNGESEEVDAHRLHRLLSDGAGVMGADAACDEQWKVSQLTYQLQLATRDLVAASRQVAVERVARKHAESKLQQALDRLHTLTATAVSHPSEAGGVASGSSRRRGKHGRLAVKSTQRQVAQMMKSYGRARPARAASAGRRRPPHRRSAAGSHSGHRPRSAAASPQPQQMHMPVHHVDNGADPGSNPLPTPGASTPGSSASPASQTSQGQEVAQLKSIVRAQHSQLQQAEEERLLLEQRLADLTIANSQQEQELQGTQERLHAAKASSTRAKGKLRAATARAKRFKADAVKARDSINAVTERAALEVAVARRETAKLRSSAASREAARPRRGGSPGQATSRRRPHSSMSSGSRRSRGSRARPEPEPEPEPEMSEDAAAVRVQASIRGRQGRAEAKRQAAARNIQKVARGRAARRAVAKRRRRQEAERIMQEGQVKARLRRLEAKKQAAAATRIQSRYKGHAARAQLRHDRRRRQQNAREQEAAAVHMQRMARGRAARKRVEAMRLNSQVHADEAADSEGDYEDDEFDANSSPALQQPDPHRQHRAATSMQRLYRGHSARTRVGMLKREKLETDAAVTVQKVARGRRARTRVSHRREQHRAASHMQRVARGRAARQRVRELRRQESRRHGAVALQRVYRGHSARTRVGVLRNGAESASDDGMEEGSDGGVEEGSDVGMEEGSDGGVEEGSDDGMEEGSDDGMEEGSDDGMEEGSDDGAEEGSDDGAEEGSDGEDDTAPHRVAAATRLQSVARGRAGRRKAAGRHHAHKRHHAASHVQRVYRGHSARTRVSQLRQEREVAAVTMQRVARGRSARRTIKRKHAAATHVQRVARGRSGRKRARAKRIELLAAAETDDQHRAAVRLQSTYRGHAARKQPTGKRGGRPPTSGPGRQAAPSKPRTAHRRGSNDSRRSMRSTSSSSSMHDAAAQRIQGIARGRAARKHAALVKREKQVQAATVDVQRAYRGHLGRKRASEERMKQSTPEGEPERKERSQPRRLGSARSASFTSYSTDEGFEEGSSDDETAYSGDSFVDTDIAAGDLTSAAEVAEAPSRSPLPPRPHTSMMFREGEESEGEEVGSDGMDALADVLKHMNSDAGEVSDSDTQDSYSDDTFN